MWTEKENREVKKLSNIIKVKFNDLSLLTRALTHRSFTNEVQYTTKDNERLEYLGDSVLALVINEYLFKRFDSYHEGDLAKIKAAVVSEDTLARVAREIGLGEFIYLGKGEECSGGRERASILANTVEALIGAIFLDSGLRSAKSFILYYFKKHVEQINRIPNHRDPKTALQEMVQKKYKEKPSYVLQGATGPDHEKEFSVKLMICGRSIVEASGSSKRRAEMAAATKALNLIEEGELVL